jgi:hypothetical protein
MHEVFHQFCGTCPEHQYIIGRRCFHEGVELPLMVFLKKILTPTCRHCNCIASEYIVQKILKYDVTWL